MRQYQIILENASRNRRSTIKVSKISFPEAVSKAYMEINKLGFNWRVKSVVETKNKVY